MRAKKRSDSIQVLASARSRFAEPGRDRDQERHDNANRWHDGYAVLVGCIFSSMSRARVHACPSSTRPTRPNEPASSHGLPART